MQCSTRFQVDAQGTITSWSWQGNACRAYVPASQQKAQHVVQKVDPEVQHQRESLNEEFKHICDNPEYKALFIKTPCNGNEITFTQLVDNTKITKELKSSFLKWREEVDALYTQLNNSVQRYGNSADKQLTTFTSSLRLELDKPNLDLYNGTITWGSYNQARKNANSKIIAKQKNLLGK